LLAELDVATWADGHDGILPADLMAYLPSSPWHNEAFWRSRLADSSRQHWVWLVETTEPVGYVTFGSKLETGFPAYCGEIERFYLLDAWRGRGLGSLIWREAVAQLARADLLPHITTVFTFNTDAQRFYERHGGKRLGEQTAFEWRGMPIRESVYGFESHGRTH